ncbi:MAG: DUF3810 domain-containing protein [Oscillospiraceae bacterium]|nr:DUF3810 domain-containing protein [Oscillospiraceae bacterium]
MRKKYKTELSPSARMIFTIWMFLIIINILSRFMASAVDFYIRYIFPTVSDFWCSVSGLADFSVGEYMIVIGIALVGIGILSFLLFMIFAKRRRGKIARIYGHFYGWILTWLFFVLTFRFFILYQGTQMSTQTDNLTFENKKVLEVYELLVEQANQTAKKVNRDDTGHFVLAEDTEMMREAKNCMRRLSQEFPQYKGVYPDAKPIAHSYFFTQQNLLGIYFPFSMEANYNPVVYEVNLPVIICHEFTHLKGNIFEDEAGYLAFRACLTSENPDFIYSGYISVLGWLDLDFGADAIAWEQYQEITDRLSPEVRTDLYSFVPDDYYQMHRHEEVIPTAIVSDVADTVMDANLKANGIPEGKESYHGLTGLVLCYYIYGW